MIRLTFRRLMVMTTGLWVGLVCGASVFGQVNTITIHGAAAVGDDDALYEIIAADPSAVFQHDEDGNTALHLAAKNLRPSTVLRLLNAGAEYDAKDGDGNTALHLAVLHGGSDLDSVKRRVDIVQFLLLQGASVNARDARGRTPMHLAAIKDRFEVLDSLNRMNAKLDALDDLGRTPMHLSAQHGTLGVLNWLVRRKMPISVRDERGYTPLHLAAERAQEKTVKRLLELGASPSDTAQDGRTPLHLLAASASKDKATPEQIVKVAKLLMAHGADPNRKDESGASAIDLAEKTKQQDLIRVLREYKETK